MTDYVWWAAGVLNSHHPRDAFDGSHEAIPENQRAACLEWNINFIGHVAAGRLSPPPPSHKCFFARRVDLGNPMPPEILQQILFYSEGRRLSPIIGEEYHWIFCHEALDCMRALDLPGVQFFENGKHIQLYDAHDEIEVHEPAALFNPAAAKDTVLREKSPLFQERSKGSDRLMSGITASRLHNRRKPDSGLVVSPAAIEGPSVWVEKRYRKVLFFADDVKRRVEAFGLAEVFDFRRVTVLKD